MKITVLYKEKSEKCLNSETCGFTYCDIKHCEYFKKRKIKISDCPHENKETYEGLLGQEKKCSDCGKAL